VHHAAGLNGLGTGSYIDHVVLRDRDADANGSLEERHYYCQSWRHDVVAVIDHQGHVVEHTRYTPYGIPISIPMADKNLDGLLDSTGTDATLQGNAISAAYNVWYDNDLDGDVDFTDLSLWLAQYNAIAADGPFGAWRLSAYGHDLGYAGYRWAAPVGMYHVRYRWYDAESGVWLSPDPLEYIDGSNLFMYAGGMPGLMVDPYGLSYSDDFGEGAKHVWDTLFGDPNKEANDWANMISRVAAKQAKKAKELGLRCLAESILRGAYGGIGDALDRDQDAADTTVKLLIEVTVTVAAAVPVTKIIKHIRIGREYQITKNLRIAPWGNRVNPKWPAGSTAFQKPHYHRRITDRLGNTVPGGGMKYHRPWEQFIPPKGPPGPRW
jgi:RHS repeat-associated protein